MEISWEAPGGSPWCLDCPEQHLDLVSRVISMVINICPNSPALSFRYKDDVDSPTEENGKQKVLYSLEFTFDADARVAITIYCQATEEFVGGMAV